MDIKKFKLLIKESVREVFNEEMKTILLEALKGNKQSVLTETKMTQSDDGSLTNFRNSLRNSIMGEEGFNFNTNNLSSQPKYTPPPVSTVGEGTALPVGEVSLDQIMNLITK